MPSGTRIETRWEATPVALSWIADDGARIDAVFASRTRVHLRGHGMSLRFADAAAELTPFTGAYLFTDPRDASTVFTSYETGRRYRIAVTVGTAVVDGAESLGVAERSVTVSGEDGWEAIIDEFDAVASVATMSFDDSAAAVDAEFADFLDQIAPWRAGQSTAVSLAAYVVWSATVEPHGYIRWESVLMSKHWMDKLWSWDHCFNALALAGSARLAIDQFLAPFDHQDAAGALPDSITHSEVLYNYVKPPIHGWALAKLRPRLSEELDRPHSSRSTPGCPPGPASGWTLDEFPAMPSPTISTATTAGGTTRRCSTTTAWSRPRIWRRF